MELTHKALVLRAVQWLRSDYWKCKLVFAEMVTSAWTTPDAIGWIHGGASILVEAKISRRDFFSDRKKIAFTLPSHAIGRRRWYLTPKDLVRPEETPEGWGLAYVVGRRVQVVQEAPERLPEPAAQQQETILLLSAIRRLSLGAKFDERTGRWERLEDRLARRDAT